MSARPFTSLVDALAAAPADRTFVIHWIDEDEQQTITFGEFRQRAAAQCANLRSRGVGSGDRVLIIMPQSIGAMTSFVGAMMIGAVPAFLAYPNFKIEASKYRSGLQGVTANLSAKVILIDDEFPADLLEHVSISSGTLLRASSPTQAVTASEIPAPSADSIAFIQHSAGTTGLQKGVALTHRTVLKQIEYLSERLQIDCSTDRVYSWLPLYHDMGLIACFMLPLICHLPIVMQSPMDWVMHPEIMLQAITEHSCTLAWMPNFAFQFLPRRTSKRRWSDYNLSSLRALINCSEPVRAASMNEFRTAFSSLGLRPSALQTSYAMAETVFAVSQSELSAPPPVMHADQATFTAEHRIVPAQPGKPSVTFVSSGRRLRDTEVRILQSTGEVGGAGQVGEIIVKTPSMFSGYYNRPDLTSEVMVDGWYRTGDLGFLADDEIYVVGRKKDLLIIGGENIYPQDLEEIVSTHPAIHDGRVVATSAYNPDLGTEEIVVVAEVEDETELACAEQIERELRASIVAALGVSVRTILLKAPKWIVKSSAGKPARSATRTKLAQEHPELMLTFQEEHA